MLTGKTNEERIWNYLTAAGMTACGAAGLMGNLYAESGLIPANLQNTYEKKLGYTDAAYTAAVDSGAYTNFAKTGPGMGWLSGPITPARRRCWPLPRRRESPWGTWRRSLLPGP